MDFESLRGVVLMRIDVLDDEIIFHEFANNRKFRMYHIQDCCEHVYIESIVGSMDDLLFAPILMAEEATQTGTGAESETWTFYKLATIKGYVDIRWYGSSNGYYSESVSFEEIT